MMEAANNSDFSWVRIRDGRLTKNGEIIAVADNAGDMYRELGCSYPKFFKMDVLSRWAWLGAEALLRSPEGWVYDGLAKDSLGLVLATLDGCLDADRKYADSMAGIASPALFVYTLPNIMLGEICIRHGFKGEQLCLIADEFDAGSLQFQAQDLLLNRGISHCLFGWADAVESQHDICLFWAAADGASKLRAELLQSIHQNY